MNSMVLRGTVIVVVEHALKLSVLNKLRREGSRIVVARDTMEALALHRTHHADLVVGKLDASAPEGLLVCRKLADGGAAVVLVAENASSDTFLTCLRAGATRVFSRSSSDALAVSHIVYALETRATRVHGTVDEETSAECETAERAGDSRWAFKASLLDIPSIGASPVDRLASQASDAWFWLKHRARSFYAQRLGEAT